jgi:hypothetical protein
VPTFLDMLTKNPHGWGGGPALRNQQPAQPTGEIRNLPARPTDPFATPIAETLSPTLGGFGAGQMAGEAFMRGQEGDYLGALGPASLAVFGMLPAIENLPLSVRKPADWGGSRRLSQARVAERGGLAPEDIWEQHGWARNPMDKADPRFNPAVPADQWYAEFGSSPKALGDRYELGIGGRKRTAPWQAADEPPEVAFDAEIRNDARGLLAEQEAAPLDQRKIAAAKAAESKASFNAVDVAKRIRAAEDQMRAAGASETRIANKLKSDFGATVKPDDIKSGQVWWRVTDKETLGPGKWERPTGEVLARPDVQKLIKQQFAARKSHTSIALAVEKATGVPVSYKAISRWTDAQGMTRDPVTTAKRKLTPRE